MTRRRLRKNADRNHGARTGYKNATEINNFPSGKAATQPMNSGSSSCPVKSSETANDEHHKLVVDDGGGSLKRYNNTKCLSNIVKHSKTLTRMRFRCVDVQRGRTMNEHNEALQVVMMELDDEMDQLYPRGLTGLSNLGNTCYMNAAIQALSNCPPFADFFRSLTSLSAFSSKSLDVTDESLFDIEPSISRAFRRLLQSIWSEERTGCVSPQAFLMQIQHHCPQFRGWSQQDAQEFIRCLLDLLHHELRQPIFEWDVRNVERLKRERKNSMTSETSNATSNSPFLRRSASSCSGNLTSDDDEHYETADSGWSSDGETPATSKAAQDSDLGSAPFSEFTVRNENSVEESNNKSKVPLYYRSIVTDVFDGQLRSVVKCLTCHHLSQTFETFQDLSLSIPNSEQLERTASNFILRDIDGTDSGQSVDTQMIETNKESFSGWHWPWWLGGFFVRSLYQYFFGESVSLNDALAAFFSPDDLRGENMYSCEKCCKLRNGIKMCKIVKAPEILCIHLKKFRHELSYSSKVKTRVTFPMYELDLSPFITKSGKHEENIYLYDLCAFITHYGGSLDSGHYVAYCKNEVDENWYEYDDNVVTRLEPADILTKEAYVLFYQRQSHPNMDSVKRKMKDMLGKAAAEDNKIKTSIHYYISREWLHRFSTFSHPGPITNYDFLCEHAQILPRRATNLTEYYATIDSALWIFLSERFGGGPATTELHYCPTCEKSYQYIRLKRKSEVIAFNELESRLRSLKMLNASLTYSYYMPPNLIVKSWVDKWKAFVDENEFESPGAIDNHSLLTRSPKDSKLRLSNTQHVQVPREIWLFFYSIYGGGPEVLYVTDVHPTTEVLNDVIAKIDAKIAETAEKIEDVERARLLGHNTCKVSTKSLED